MLRNRCFSSAILVNCAALAVAAGCSSHPSGNGTPGTNDPPVEPGSPSAAKLGGDAEGSLQSIQQQLTTIGALDAATFGARYAVKFSPERSYDPSKAAHFEAIGAAFALKDSDIAQLTQHGFLISDLQRFPSFVYGYETIYLHDLPVYVSADSILEAVHRSYDKILATVETASLLPALHRMLATMRGHLADVPEGSAAQDADVYLAVAASLLDGSAPPVRGGDAELVASLVDKANAASGTEDVTLFGSPRTEDFSQYKPRGHYAADPRLSAYFRAMMWLGRVDMRIIETQGDGSQIFRRRQLEAALLLRDLLGSDGAADWKALDDAIKVFVGEQDYMTVPEVDRFLAGFGAAHAADIASQPDEKLAQAIVDANYGAQRILNAVIVNDTGTGTLPLSASFTLLGQRYVVDSHVFSNVVYDRVAHGAVKRMMPSPLDAAFAALKNDQAGALLKPELEKYPYAEDLASMRVLVESNSPEFWGGSLYNLWLSGLRELSPPADLASAAGLVAPFNSEAWGRRLLNAQLASWAELRHDTLLYAKQSYTSGNSCEFPAAYVDPYPGFFHRIGEFATRGGELVASLDFSASPGIANSLNAYFTRLGTAATLLEGMATNEVQGAPLTAEQLAFINQAVKVQQGCGSPAGFEGWYAQLYYDNLSGVEADPTIADVHTQPTDEVGTEVGRVLHVGTGLPRLLVVTTDGCDGPHAYAGLASSYFERVTEHYERLDDQGWATDVSQVTPEDVAWMKDLVVR
jgi:Protein of unknown function (DUF3160)